MRPEIRFTPPRRARRRMAGLVMPVRSVVSARPLRYETRWAMASDSSQPIASPRDHTRGRQATDSRKHATAVAGLQTPTGYHRWIAQDNKTHPGCYHEESCGDAWHHPFRDPIHQVFVSTKSQTPPHTTRHVHTLPPFPRPDMLFQIEVERSKLT